MLPDADGIAMHGYVLIWTFIFFTIGLMGQNKSQYYYNDFSEAFLEAAIKNTDQEKFLQELARVSVDSLALYLDSDEKRIAFWVNIYNAFVQHLLHADPSKYEDKNKFFSHNQLRIFGETISLDKIEHGIIRRSQWKYGLGEIRTLFPPEFEKKLRLQVREPRVHFVLNCGAKSCPMTVILRPASLEDQLRTQTISFIKQTSVYKEEVNEVEITSLFSWFRGDFGGKRGIRKFLAFYEIIPDESKPGLVFADYDWTLDLDNHNLTND